MGDEHAREERTEGQPDAKTAAHQAESPGTRCAVEFLCQSRRAARQCARRRDALCGAQQINPQQIAAESLQ